MQMGRTLKWSHHLLSVKPPPLPQPNPLTTSCGAPNLFAAHRKVVSAPHYRGEGIWCRVNFVVVNVVVGIFAEAPAFCVVNFADTPRNLVVCRALRARWSSATGATYNAGTLPHSASDEGQIGLRS